MGETEGTQKSEAVGVRVLVLSGPAGGRHSLRCLHRSAGESEPCGLPGDPAKGRAQARPPDAPTTRRPSSARSRQAQGRSRLRAARRRREPRASRHARAHPPRQRLGREHRLNTQDGPRAARPGPTRNPTRRPPHPNTPAPRQAEHRRGHDPHALTPPPRLHRTPIHTSLLGAAAGVRLPSSGHVTIAGRGYFVRSFGEIGWGNEPLTVWILEGA
jgi:hypothetical protein